MLDEEATLPGIRRHLKKLERLVADASPEEKIRVLFFFSGHGHFADLRSTNSSTEGFFFVTHDSDHNNLCDTALSFSELEVTLQKMHMKGCQTFLISDCCFSSAGVTKSVQKERVVAKQKILRGKAIGEASIPHTLDPYKALSKAAVTFAACGPTDDAYEFHELQHGLFTYALLEALSGVYCKASDEYINPSTLYNHIRKAAEQAIKQRLSHYGRIQQNPVSVIELYEDVVFPILPISYDPFQKKYERKEELVSSPVPDYYQTTPVEEQIKILLTDESIRLYFFTGERLSGKSTTLSKCLRDLARDEDSKDNKQPWGPTIWINCHEEHTLDKIAPFVASVLRGKGGEDLFEATRRLYPHHQQKALVRPFVQALAKANATLVLDHADRALGVMGIPIDPSLREFLLILAQEQGGGRVIVIQNDWIPPDFLNVRFVNNFQILSMTEQECSELAYRFGFPKNIRELVSQTYMPRFPFNIRCLRYLFENKKDFSITQLSQTEIIYRVYETLPLSSKLFLQAIAVYNGPRNQEVMDRCYDLATSELDSMRPKNEELHELQHSTLLVKDVDTDTYTIHSYIKSILRMEMNRDNMKNVICSWNNEAAQYYLNLVKNEFSLPAFQECLWHYDQGGRIDNIAMMINLHWKDLTDRGHGEAAKEWLDRLLWKSQQRIIHTHQAILISRDKGPRKIKDQSLLFGLLDRRFRLARHLREFNMIEKVISKAKNIAKKENCIQWKNKIKFREGETNLIRRHNRSALEILEDVRCNAGDAYFEHSDFDAYEAFCDCCFRISEIWHDMGKCLAALRALEICTDYVANPVKDTTLDSNKYEKIFIWKRKELAKIESRKAAVLIDLGRFVEAKELARLSLARNLYPDPPQAGDILGQAISALYLSCSYAGEGNNKMATVYAKTALELLHGRGLSEQWWLILAHIRLGMAYTEAGDFKHAKESLCEAERWTKMNVEEMDEWRLCEVMESQAYLAYRMQKYSDSLNKVKSGLSIATNCGHERCRARLMCLRGKIRWKMAIPKKTPAKEKQGLDNAHKDLWMAATSAVNMGMTTVVIDSLFALSQIAEARGNLVKAYRFAIATEYLAKGRALEARTNLKILRKIQNRVKKYDRLEYTSDVLQELLSRKEGPILYPYMWQGILKKVAPNKSDAEVKILTLELNRKTIKCLSQKPYDEGTLCMLILRLPEPGTKPFNVGNWVVKKNLKPESYAQQGWQAQLVLDSMSAPHKSVEDAWHKWLPLSNDLLIV